MAPPARHTKSPAWAVTTTIVAVVSGMGLLRQQARLIREPHPWCNGQDIVYNLGDAEMAMDIVKCPT